MALLIFVTDFSFEFAFLKFHQMLSKPSAPVGCRFSPVPVVGEGSPAAAAPCQGLAVKKQFSASWWIGLYSSSQLMGFLINNPILLYKLSNIQLQTTF